MPRKNPSARMAKRFVMPMLSGTPLLPPHAVEGNPGSKKVMPSGREVTMLTAGSSFGESRRVHGGTPPLAARQCGRYC
jgi:hypothetical protein